MTIYNIFYILIYVCTPTTTFFFEIKRFSFFKVKCSVISTNTLCHNRPCIYIYFVLDSPLHPHPPQPPRLYFLQLLSAQGIDSTIRTTILVDEDKMESQ